MASGIRNRLRWIFLTALLVFFGLLLGDALGLFRSQPYTAIPHGGHAHYVPDDKDESVDLSQCPNRAPAPDELLTPQCQLVRIVRQGNAVRYVPSDVTGGVALDRFPTRPPGSGELITPDGRMVSVPVQATR